MAKKKATAPIKIPFYKTGGLAAGAPAGSSGSNWKDNYEFDALLTFTGFERGRISMIRGMFTDEAGRVYPMFMADLAKLLTEAGVVGGKVRARWTFVKWGSDSYGVCRVPGPAAVHPDVATLAAEMLSGDRTAAAAFVDRASEVVQGG